MRTLFKKLKLRYILIIVIVGVILQFAFTILKSPYLEFPLEKSSNPKASEHFINAMQYKFMINTLHKIVDFDSFLMKPLLNKMNHEYETGRELLPKNSAEDVYWYVVLYRGIHGIGGTPDKRDMSLAYKNILSQEEYKKHYEQIVDKIKRLVIDDFVFDVPRVNQYKFEFMSNLVNEFRTAILLRLKNKNNLVYLNNYLEDSRYIYLHYSQFKKKYLPIANKQKENEIASIYNEIQLLSYIIILENKQNKNNFSCNKREYKILLKNLKILKQQDVTNKYKNSIFEKGRWLCSIVESLAKCPELQQEANEVLQYFSPELVKKDEE